MMIKNGTTFKIQERNRLYYLQTVEDYSQCKNKDKVNLTLDINGWHETFAHLTGRSVRRHT